VREIRTLRSFGGRRLRLDGGASSYQLRGQYFQGKHGKFFPNMF